METLSFNISDQGYEFAIHVLRDYLINPFQLTVGFLSIISNCVIILLLQLMKQNRRNNFHVNAFNLATCDCVLAIFDLTMPIYRTVVTNSSSQYSHTTCGLFFSLIAFGSMAIPYCVLCMSSDRFICLIAPLFYHKYVSRQSRKTIFTVGLVSGVIFAALSIIVNYQDSDIPLCSSLIIFDVPFYTAITTVATIMTSSSVILYIVGFIAILVRKKLSIGLSQSIRVYRKVDKLIACVVLCESLFGVMPALLVNHSVLRIFSPLAFHITPFVICFSHLNSVSNLLIYLLFNEEIRAQFLLVVAWCTKANHVFSI